MGGILETECRSLMTEFFRKLRNANSNDISAAIKARLFETYYLTNAASLYRCGNLQYEKNRTYRIGLPL